jgi:hypothetical protein
MSTPTPNTQEIFDGDMERSGRLLLAIGRLPAEHLKACREEMNLA